MNSSEQQRERDLRRAPQQQDEHQRNERTERGDEQLEHLARTIDPPGREVSDDELSDPGRAIPTDRKVDNRS